MKNTNVDHMAFMYIDEANMSTISKKTPKVVTHKNINVVPAERAITFTAVMCMRGTRDSTHGIDI